MPPDAAALELRLHLQGVLQGCHDSLVDPTFNVPYMCHPELLETFCAIEFLLLLILQQIGLEQFRKDSSETSEDIS